MNETIVKFGYPATLIADFTHWLVLLRPAQPTLGSLVLAAKSDATAFGDLPEGAHAELKPVTAAIERTLAGFVDYQRLNYLMLMMVDPHVHFHVLPRYADARHWEGLEFRDEAWPGPPQLAGARILNADEIVALASHLRSRWR